MYGRSSQCFINAAALGTQHSINANTEGAKFRRFVRTCIRGIEFCRRSLALPSPRFAFLSSDRQLSTRPTNPELDPQQEVLDQISLLPEKNTWSVAMGPEPPIEPWLAPDNRAACGLRTDWLRRAKAMKAAGKKNQTRCPNEAASREHETEGQNNPAQRGGLEGKKTSSRRRSVFSLIPFIGLIRRVDLNR
jgi:hypothetical protein